tara:strand:- start:1044 stop:1556 length:513 start_codon:yes stop_codon:yes gene_type:complete
MMSCKGKVEDEEEKEAKQEARDVVVRSCRPRRKRGIIVIIIVVVVVVVVMRVDVPSASSGDALGRRQRQCFSKVPVWVWPTPVLENDPPRNKKNKTRKMSKNSQNIPVYMAAQVLQHISLSLYREREKKEAEVHALGSSYVISFSLVSPLLFLPFQSFLSFLSATILLLV